MEFERNEEMESLKEQLREEQKNSIKSVFNNPDPSVDPATAEKISRTGFDNGGDFHDAIRQCTMEINEINELLNSAQIRLISLKQRHDLLLADPSLDITNCTSKIEREMEAIKRHAAELKSKVTLLENQRTELKIAYGLFRKNFKEAHNTELKEWKKDQDALQRAEAELKSRHDKILLGTATNLDKARHAELDKEVIPDMKENLGYNKSEAEKKPESKAEPAKPEGGKAEEFDMDKFLVKENLEDYSEVELNKVREALGLKADEEVTKDHIDLFKATALTVGTKERKKVTMIDRASDKLRGIIDGAKAHKALLAGAGVAALALLIAAPAAAIGIGAAAIGAGAVAEFNKGRKL